MADRPIKDVLSKDKREVERVLVIRKITTSCKVLARWSTRSHHKDPQSGTLPIVLREHYGNAAGIVAFPSFPAFTKSGVWCPSSSAPLLGLVNNAFIESSSHIKCPVLDWCCCTETCRSDSIIMCASARSACQEEDTKFECCQ